MSNCDERSLTLTMDNYARQGFTFNQVLRELAKDESCASMTIAKLMDAYSLAVGRYELTKDLV
jgi:hypothetical protein